MNKITLTFRIMAFFSIIVTIPTFAGSSIPLPDVDNLPTITELPDPLILFDGTPVKTKEQWFNERRPELKKLFQHYMYGYMPEPPEIEVSIQNVDDQLFGGKAVLKEIEILFKNLEGKDVPRIHLALFIPNVDGKKFPVFLALNKCGNHTVVDYPGVTIHEDAWLHSKCLKGEEARGVKKDFWCVEYLIERGYAFATYHESNIDPDRNNFTDGIHPHYTNLPGAEEAHWGTIAAWAWGLQRCVDYLVTDENIDKDRICVIGHSRRGKTALLAAAFDERFAMAVPHQSGTGGCALSRNNDQETVKRINQSFPHWFNDHFTIFNDREEKLPIDQHLLMALMAPRPLLDTAGLQDKWANYESALRALKAADKVYEFLGKDGIVGDGVVLGDEPIEMNQVGELLQYRRDTKHTLNIGYWEKILDFADLSLAE